MSIQRGTTAISTAVTVGGIDDGMLVGVFVAVGTKVGVNVGVGVVGIPLLLHDAASRATSRTAYLSFVFMGISFCYKLSIQIPKCQNNLFICQKLPIAKEKTIYTKRN